MNIAVPTGASAFDENGVRCRGRSKAVTYNPSKPDKYAIRFYASVGWKYPYLHSFNDNGAGNKYRETFSSARQYAADYKQMRHMLKNMMYLDQDKASALWVLQMAHQSKLHEDPSGRRLFLWIISIHVTGWARNSRKLQMERSVSLVQ